ncbi:kinase-like domain-containing protein [Aspergillus germanicus]
MASTTSAGQIVRGRMGVYTIVKRLEDCVWLAANENQEKVIAKSVRHFRLQNERDILVRFQHRTPFICPLVEEIDESEESKTPPTLILSVSVKYVARGVLEALCVLHEDGFVHTDIKPSNVLLNYSQSDRRFSGVQLADFGSTVHVDSIHAQRGDAIGTPIFRSPEAQMEMKWSTATDIWSFGTMLISLLYGEGFHIFKPNVPPDHGDYDTDILLEHHRCFEPFPKSYAEIADETRLAVLISREDKKFVLRSMNLDPRNRPSARQLLEDEWFRRP